VRGTLPAKHIGSGIPALHVTWSWPGGGRTLESVPTLVRRAGRRTNLALLALLIVAAVTGALGYAVGSPRLASVAITVAHGAAGLALLLLVPWKSFVVRRSWRRVGGAFGGGHGESLALGVLVACCLAAGIAHGLGGWTPVLGITPLQVHVAAALVAIPFVVLHAVGRPQPLRRADLSRRTFLRAVTLGAGGIAAYGLVQGAAFAAGLPGGVRSRSGSTQRGSLEPTRMPVTQWFTDVVPSSVPSDWRLEMTVGQQQHSFTYGQLSRLATHEVTATLDCTGGWYAVQRWRGVRLDDLVAALEAAGPWRSIDVVSATGYRRRLPRADGDSALLATHAGDSPLSLGHGAPVRLVVPGRRGFWWVKWVQRVDLVDEPWWWQPPYPLQ
jgi:DMSO/TMAO reductase YedYZ molybdopterin-dependent catalytic subunit